MAHFFYQQAIYLDKKDGLPPPYVHYQLSRIAFIEGNLDVAMQEIYNELDIYPQNTHTYYIKGLTLGYMNREHEAIDAFSKFIEYKPESWAARNDKAWLQFRIGEIDEAMLTILPAVQNHPDNPWLLNTFGVLLMNQGHFTEAENALNRALELSMIMTEESWGRAYPGNSPQIYKQGLDAMRKTIKENLTKIKSRQN
ncbi:MAG: tetratricopeptide repeat protein [Candidatus Paceibacterota bacterium]